MQFLILAAVVIVLIVALVFLIPGIIGAPYVPSEQKDIERAFTKLYPLSAKDSLVDLGAGNGIVVLGAVEHGAKAIGVEINPLLAFITKRKLAHEQHAKIVCGDMYRFKLPKETTVVYAYATNYIIPQIFKRVQSEANRLNKKLYLISNAYDYKGAKPKKHLAPYYLYEIKPANK